MNFNKSLSHEDVHLQIMTKGDFNRLFAVAKDPEIWDQHNDKERYKLNGFKEFFDSGINNLQNCYLIFYKDDLVGSTRYYEYDTKKSSLKIGFTFYAKEYWGTSLNRKVKKLMLDYAFRFIDNVLFDVWPENFRSQKAVQKLCAKLYKIDKNKEKYTFILSKEVWKGIHN
ncbi:GNAT family N-acetyltransferase [Francisella adeliensis]|uniref:GNAT family N-acetyltransferase n=1 Tax=Francisella adeliensis TaxID=2007306 RepID=A0A2Z4XXI8_9GAMM|nr:GNAT family N-acetyltransferase [Francisella adeliensis]AXA33328.1 GNAT family N-acetyltransferase [Francisella adeliensis]MBK2085338.1 GNAT family N-acetyltransferase [Francisella adeliensis]MBK2097068.1 GNAT family N-acetyltransferase [Francisella adeliensis]QIW11557.1 GNAT family N-acetyltransferase [Francisella adeliensis]QIW13431.1 GNAT family N-acetyltransferase [Francisella adeliensis]